MSLPPRRLDRLAGDPMMHIGVLEQRERIPAVTARAGSHDQGKEGKKIEGMTKERAETLEVTALATGVSMEEATDRSRIIATGAGDAMNQ